MATLATYRKQQAARERLQRYRLEVKAEMECYREFSGFTKDCRELGTYLCPVCKARQELEA